MIEHEGPDTSTYPPKTRHRILITVALLLTIVVIIGVGYYVGTSTVRGWSRMASGLGATADTPGGQRSLAPGSEVTYRGARVGILTSRRMLPRDVDLGGQLWLIEGVWDESSTASAAREDTSLVGVFSTPLRESGQVTIELVSAPSMRRTTPRGLLRLRPFRRGYRFY